MKKISALSLISLLAVFSVSPAFAGDGGSGGIGSDLKTRDPGDAWFVGLDNVITLCIEHKTGSSFSLNDEKLKSAITESFKQWDDYIRLKLPETVRKHPETLPSTKINFVNECSKSNLTFYMGIDTPETDRVRRSLQNPMAFVGRRAPRSNSGLIGGFVWFKDMSCWDAKPQAFQANMNHEIGHILGTEHVRLTVMDGNLAEYTQGVCLGKRSIRGNLDSVLSDIDQEHQLILPERLAAFKSDFFGVISLCTADLSSARCLDNLRTSEGTFAKFMGRVPMGKIATHVRVESSGFAESNGIFKYLTNPFANQLTKVVLEISDEVGKKEFPVSVLHSYTKDFDSNTGVGSKAFFSIKDGQKNFVGASVSASARGKIDVGDVVYPVNLEFNSAYPSPLRVTYEDGDSIFELVTTRFTSDQAGSWNPYQK